MHALDALDLNCTVYISGLRLYTYVIAWTVIYIKVAKALNRIFNDFTAKHSAVEALFDDV